MDDVHRGGCQCGQVRFETQGAPVKAVACHCRYCQTRTGSAFGVSTYFPRDKVQVSGAVKTYAFKTESGRDFTNYFCPDCGSTTHWVLGMTPDLVGVAAGAFDPPTFWFAINREVFTRSAAPFVHNDLPDKSETTSSYAPVTTDGPALRGG